MYKKILILCLFIMLCMPAIAQDDEIENSEEDLDSYLDHYEQYSFDKIISDKEFDAAYNTVKNMQMTSKQKKQQNKSIQNKNQGMANKGNIKMPLAPSNPLLRLPVDVYADNSVLKNGFYIVKHNRIGNQTFLRFIQSGELIAEIQAQKLITDENLSSVKAEFVNGYVNIKYINNDKLQVKLPIYKQ